MSAATVLPHDQNHSDEPPRKRNLGLRILAWLLGIFVLLAIVAGVGIVVIMHSSRVHQYVLRTAQQKVTDALGTKVQMRDFTLHTPNLWNYSLDLYDVVISGAAPYPDPPIAQVQHLNVGLHVTSLLHKTFYVDNIAVDHPVIRAYFDKSGKNNIPSPKSSGQKSNTTIWSLGVRRAVLSGGEVYYNDDKTVLEADLHDVTFDSMFAPADTRYSGDLSYKNGRLKTSTYNPIPHDFQAQFDATPSRFALKRAVLNSGRSQIVLTATVDNYDDPVVKGTYDANVDAGEFRHILKNPSLPEGLLHAAGDLAYHGEPNRQLMEVIRLNGDLSSRGLLVLVPSQRLNINDIGAHYAIANGDLNVTNMHARLLGGAMTGKVTMKAISGTNPASHLQATLRGIQVADVKPFLPASMAKQVALEGTVNADTDVRWGKSFDTAVALANADINATVAAAATGNTVPVNGVIHARYDMATKVASLKNSVIRLPQTALTMNGTVSDRSELRVQLHSNELHELESLAEMFQTAKPGSPPPTPLGLYGSADLNGAVSGSTAAPHFTGQLVASNLKVRGTEWRLLRTGIDASPSQAALRNGVLQPATEGRITFGVSTSLSKWSFTDASEFQVSLNASSLKIADFTKAAGIQQPLSGLLSADLQAHGTELNPIGQGNLTLLNATSNGQQLGNLKLAFEGTGDEVHGTLNARSVAGDANARFAYAPKQQGYTVQLTANNLQLNKIKALTDKVPDLYAVVNLNASGHGTIKDPQLTASLQIPKLVAQKQAVNNIVLNTTIVNHVANIALDSNALNSSISGRGTVELTGDYNSDISLNTQAIPLAPLVAIYAPTQAGQLTGTTELHATVRGPLKNPAALEAHATIPALQLNYNKTVQIAAAGPIRLDYRNGRLDLQRSAIRGTDTDLTLQASVPVVNKNDPMSLLLQGNINLAIAQLFIPDVSTSGQIQFDINSFGRTANPDVQGQVRVVNASFASGDLPVGLNRANGVLTLTKDRLNITSFTGDVGGGTVTASGGVMYRPSVQFNLALAMRGIRMMYPAGLREGMGGDLTLAGTLDAATLGGQVRVSQLSFAPDFDLTSFLGQLSAGGAEPPPTQGFTQNLALRLSVVTPNGINLVNRTLSLDAGANLQVRGTAAQPVILGRVNLNSGDLIFNGDRFTLQGGTVDFVDPTQTKPNLNVAVDTNIQQYDIHMRFNGPVDHMQTLYSSDPALPQADIINLLAFGKTSEASAANPTPGNSGAQSLIASGVASQVSSRLEKVAGISQLSIDPVLGGSGSQQNPGARVTVRQRVTGNLFVTFSTDVTNTQNQAIQGQYKLSPRVSISGTRDQNGGFAADALINKRW